MFLLQDPSDLEKEHLKVYLRIRPFSAAELVNGESQVKIRKKWFKDISHISSTPKIQTLTQKCFDMVCLVSVFWKECVAIQPPETVLLKAPRSSLSARLSDKSVPVTAQRFQFSQAS